MSVSGSPVLEARYRCIRGCEPTYSLEQVIYRCPRCSGLLEVQHDLEALGATPAAEWRRLFDRRRAGAAGSADASGVWSRREWVHPSLAPEEIVSFAEGNTPLLDVPGALVGSAKLWIKQCGTSHSGSFKDLGMTVLVSAAARIRRSVPTIRAVACASTGDTSAALAAYCARAKIPALVLLPEGKVSPAQLLQPIANGALVCALRTDFDGCMKVVQALCEGGHIYLANSMNSLRVEGQKTVGIEICQQLGWRVPDWIVIPGGNLGNISALGRGLQMMQHLGLVDRLPRLACAQAARANPLYLSYRSGFRQRNTVVAGQTVASAIRIGDPVSYEKAVATLRTMDGVVEQATEQEIADAAALADRTGLLACPHTAVAIACARKLVAAGTIRKTDEVVVVSTAHGLKFTDFKAAYHGGRLDGIETRFGNPHHVLDPVAAEVLRVLDARAEAGAGGPEESGAWRG
jgi:threonine synthase